MKRSLGSIIVAAVATACVVAPVHGASGSPVRQSGSIAYASGGISEEAREALRAIGSDFNLKLILATESGAYLSDVGVIISDDRGQRLLETRSEGPWFYARLPAGRYSIEASANGTVVRRSVSVGRQLSQVDFRWPD